MYDNQNGRNLPGDGVGAGGFFLLDSVRRGRPGPDVSSGVMASTTEAEAEVAAATK